MRIAAPTLTTTGLSLTHYADVRMDYDDWYCCATGHSIDAPAYVPSGQVAYSPQTGGAFSCILSRDLAFWRWG